MKKYNEETKAVGFRVPLSEIGNVRELVYNYLNGKIKENEERVLTEFINEHATLRNESTGMISLALSGSCSTHVGIPTTNENETITTDYDNNHILSYQCGCTYSNNLFQRKKGCGLTKVQHDNLNTNNNTPNN